jgi:excisionase family DNA binding protein
MDKSEGLLNAEAAANYLSISRAHLYSLIARGDIRGVRLAGARRFPIDELREYVEKLRADALVEV